jgi:hypothetical protein
VEILEKVLHFSVKTYAITYVKGSYVTADKAENVMKRKNGKNCINTDNNGVIGLENEVAYKRLRGEHNALLVSRCTRGVNNKTAGIGIHIFIGKRCVL